MPDTDEALLRTFAATRDGDAFHALAKRHLGLIFHTAYRRTGNRQIAEEVSQNILCAMARKAESLSSHPEGLAAWLHRAALFEATKAMRSERAHQKRKQLLHPDAIAPSADPSESKWIDAIPHLDAALDKLPREDRIILLLHYFENHPFPRIAGSLGKNVTAVQKQSQRALQKLARLLGSKGIALPVAVISTGLVAEAAKGPPLHLLSAAIPAALSTQGAAISNPVMLLMKSKVAVPLVFLFCATPLAFQQHAISKLARENDRLRGPALAANQGSTRPQHPVSAIPNSAGFSSSLDIHVLLEECDQSSLTGRHGIFQAKLNSIAPETLVRLIKECADVRIRRDRKHQLINQLVMALGETNPALAVRTAVAAFSDIEQMRKMLDDAQAVTLELMKWAASDPDEAVAWYVDLTGSWEMRPNGRSSAEFASRSLLKPLVAALIGSGHPGVHILLAEKSQQDLEMAVRDSLLFFFTFDRSAQNADGPDEKYRTATQYLHFIRDHLPDELQSGMWNMLASQISSNPNFELAEIHVFFREADATLQEQEAIATSLARTRWKTRRLPFDPANDDRIHNELRAFLQDALPEQADSLINEIGEENRELRTQHARQVIDQLRANPSATDQQLADPLTREDLRAHREEAIEQAMRIQNPELRASTLELLRSR